jgi:lipopolysaccharide transport system permease protein
LRPDSKAAAGRRTPRPSGASGFETETTALCGARWRVRSLEYYRDLLWALLAKEFKVRYKSTALGYVWSVLHPLLFTLVFFFLFKVVFKIQVANYTLFLMSGVFPWQAFQNSVCSSSTALLANSSLIKRVRFPREFMVLTGVLNDLSHLVLSFPIIAAMMAWYGVVPRWDCLWALPALLIVQLVFTLGVSLVVATCNLFLRDLERLIGILTMLWFYVTPVLFQQDWVPPQYQWSNYANPMAAITIGWRHVFMGTPVEPGYMAAAAAWAAVAFVCGIVLFRRLNWKFAELV